jgi:hypothetical protein
MGEAVVPKFTSVEEADAWFAQQAKLRREDGWLQGHHDALHAGECVRWACEDDKTLVTYTKAKVGEKYGSPPRYVCVVLRGGRVIYFRAFAKRKDAKERALTEFAKSSPKWAKRNGR